MDKTKKMLYNFAELQEAFGMGKTLLYELIQYKSFPKLIINGRYYFPINDVQKWIEQHKGKDIYTRK